MLSSDTGTQPITTGTATSAEPVLDYVGQRDLEALAALSGAPAGVAELAFNAFPEGTRALVITYGLADEQSDGTLAITELGHQAIGAAAERCPEPYRDVSLDDVMKSTTKTINELVQQSGVQVQEPRSLHGRGETVASALRRHGKELIKQSQESLVHHLGSYRVKRRLRAAARAEQSDRNHDKNPIA